MPVAVLAGHRTQGQPGPLGGWSGEGEAFAALGTGAQQQRGAVPVDQGREGDGAAGGGDAPGEFGVPQVEDAPHGGGSPQEQQFQHPGGRLRRPGTRPADQQPHPASTGCGDGPDDESAVAEVGGQARVPRKDGPLRTGVSHRLFVGVVGRGRLPGRPGEGRFHGPGDRGGGGQAARRRAEEGPSGESRVHVGLPVGGVSRGGGSGGRSRWGRRARPRQPGRRVPRYAAPVRSREPAPRCRRAVPRPPGRSARRGTGGRSG
ncbi:hypothetical protein RKD37_008431 [Streptomyces ambofaciens]